MRTEIECCEGIERVYETKCLEDRCPIYKGATERIDQKLPYIGTKRGNSYEDPNRDRYLAEVRSFLKGNPKATRVNKMLPI